MATRRASPACSTSTRRPGPRRRRTAPVIFGTAIQYRPGHVPVHGRQPRHHLGDDRRGHRHDPADSDLADHRADGLRAASSTAWSACQTATCWWSAAARTTSRPAPLLARSRAELWNPTTAGVDHACADGHPAHVPLDGGPAARRHACWSRAAARTRHRRSTTRTRRSSRRRTCRRARVRRSPTHRPRRPLASRSRCRRPMPPRSPRWRWSAWRRIPTTTT